MQFFGWTLADRHAGNELPQYSADRQAGNGAELPEPLTLHFGEPHGHHVFFVRSLTLLSAAQSREILRPQAALGTGDAPSKRVCHTNAMLAPAKANPVWEFFILYRQIIHQKS